MTRLDGYVSSTRIHAVRGQHRWACVWIATVLAGLALVGRGRAGPSGHRQGRRALIGKVDFNFQVRPILSDKCFNCHGPDPRMRKAGLRLDTKEGAFGTTKSGGHAIVPGNLDDSDLFLRITAEDETERMPPKSLGRSLSPEEIDLLKRWIEEGAEWKPHWAFLTAGCGPDPRCQEPQLAQEPARFVRPGPSGLPSS